MGKAINIGLALLSVTLIIGLVVALQYLFTPPFDESRLGSSLDQIRAFNPNVLDTMILNARLNGLYLLTTALLEAFVLAIPFRKGKKWAWYATFVVVGIGVLAQLWFVYDAGPLMLSYTLPVALVLALLWAAGLAVSATEILKR
jgi:hypothetical protein